jgi:glucose-1-phosphate thymidylyltransferase
LGIEEILIISTEKFIDDFAALLGDGTEFGVNFTYVVQDSPIGIGAAPDLYRQWAQGSPVCLILGDNIFIGSGLMNSLRATRDEFLASGGAYCFLQEVADPQRYGVGTLDSSGKILSLEEKPIDPTSNLAIVGLYFLDSQAPDKSRTLSKSGRGEFEILDLLKIYDSEERLGHMIMPRGTVWLDAGTPESLLEAGQYVAIVEKRQSKLVSSPHEAAVHSGRISLDFLRSTLSSKPNSGYYENLRSITP